MGVASSGTVMAGGRIRIVDEDGCIARHGVPGELRVGGDVVFANYVGRVVASPLFYMDKHGKWFRTGDVAVLDDDGKIYILGRA